MAEAERFSRVGEGGLTREEQEAIIEAWGGWLDELEDWDWFGTLTFDDKKCLTETFTKVGAGFANRAWNWWVVVLCQMEGSPLFNLRWARFTQIQKWRGVPHFHFLAAGCKSWARSGAWSLWFKKYGIARILPYDREKGGRYYVARYVLRDHTDFDLKVGR